jgi:malic enzyme
MSEDKRPTGTRQSFEGDDNIGLNLRLKNQGLIGVDSKIPLKDSSALSLLYTPGVAAPCLEIEKTPIRSYDLTCRGNTVAVISDGSAVYGIGSAGPESALAMLEGRAVFFKTFAGVDAFPIALATQDCDEIVEIGLRLATNFGGIVLEDIAAPKCFTLERNLKKATRIPVFHNDQHGGAIAVYAALINALKVWRGSSRYRNGQASARRRRKTHCPVRPVRLHLQVQGRPHQLGQSRDRHRDKRCPQERVSRGDDEGR